MIVKKADAQSFQEYGLILALMILLSLCTIYGLGDTIQGWMDSDIPNAVRKSETRHSTITSEATYTASPHRQTAHVSARNTR